MSLPSSSRTRPPSSPVARKGSGLRRGSVTLATLSHPSTKASEVINPTLTVTCRKYGITLEGSNWRYRVPKLRFPRAPSARQTIAPRRQACCISFSSAQGDLAHHGPEPPGRDDPSDSLGNGFTGSEPAVQWGPGRSGEAPSPAGPPLHRTRAPKGRVASYGARHLPRRSSSPLPGPASISPFSYTTSPRRSVITGQPVTSHPE